LFIFLTALVFSFLSSWIYFRIFRYEKLLKRKILKQVQN